MTTSSSRRNECRGFLPSFLQAPTPPGFVTACPRVRGGRKGDARHTVSTRTRLPATCPPEIGAASSPARPQKHKHKEREEVNCNSHHKERKQTHRPASVLFYPAPCLTAATFFPRPRQQQKRPLRSTPVERRDELTNASKIVDTGGDGMHKWTLLFYRRNQSSMIG